MGCIDCGTATVSGGPGGRDEKVILIVEWDAHDLRANAEALRHGSRILSAYTLPTGVKIWIITEAEDEEGNRTSTCVLLPSEY